MAGATPTRKSGDPQDAPFAGAGETSSATLVETVAAFVAQFALAACNRLPVVTALAELKDLAGSNGMELQRISRDGGRTRCVTRLGNEATGSIPANVMSAVLDPPQGEDASGSARFVQTEIGADSSGDTQRKTQTGCCLVLRSDRTETDLLWLQFNDEPSDEVKMVLQGLAKVMARIWAKREPGLVSAMIVEEQRVQKSGARQPRNRAILGPDNIFGLSRSEFRVCNLLRTGQTPKEIAAELGVSIATVRSHLSGIYAKTETSGQLGVLHKLSQESASRLHRAVARTDAIHSQGPRERP